QPPSTLLLLGMVLHGDGENSLAVQILRQAQERHPADFWINHNLAEYLYELDPPGTEEAISCLRVAVALRPESTGARVNLGFALSKGGKLAEAETQYRKALELNPDCVLAFLNLGALLSNHKKQHEEASTAFRKAIRLNPNFATLHYNLGISLLEQGEKVEA